DRRACWAGVRVLDGPGASGPLAPARGDGRPDRGLRSAPGWRLPDRPDLSRSGRTRQVGRGRGRDRGRVCRRRSALPPCLRQPFSQRRPEPSGRNAHGLAFRPRTRSNDACADRRVERAARHRPGRPRRRHGFLACAACRPHRMNRRKLRMAFTPTDYRPYDFANRRHIGPSPAEMQEMFKVLGVKDLDELIDQTVPKSLRQEKPLDFGKPKSERELLWFLRQVAKKNKVFTSMIGQGFYGTVTPPAIQRNILENPAWYTAYTPYQPEISQGRLEALLNYQPMGCDLTGLEMANAALRYEATAAAEAMTMAQRVAKSKATAFFVDENCHPQNIEVTKVRAAPLGIEVIVGDPAKLKADAVFGGIFQYPGTYGHLTDFTPHIAKLHAAGA